MQPPCAAGWNNWEGFGAGRDFSGAQRPTDPGRPTGELCIEREVSPRSHGKGLSRRRFGFGEGVSRSDAHGT